MKSRGPPRSSDCGTLAFADDCSRLRKKSSGNRKPFPGLPRTSCEDIFSLLDCAGLGQGFHAGGRKSALEKAIQTRLQERKNRLYVGIRNCYLLCRARQQRRSCHMARHCLPGAGLPDRKYVRQSPENSQAAATCVQS